VLKQRHPSMDHEVDPIGGATGAGLLIGSAAAPTSSNHRATRTFGCCGDVGNASASPVVIQDGAVTPTEPQIPKSARFFTPGTPWAGCLVRVLEAIAKVDGIVLRCPRELSIQIAALQASTRIALPKTSGSLNSAARQRQTLDGRCSGPLTHSSYTTPRGTTERHDPGLAMAVP
jgi:hypothetical protein